MKLNIKNVYKLVSGRVRLKDWSNKNCLVYVEKIDENTYKISRLPDEI